MEGLVYPIFPGCAIVTAPGERHRCIYRSDALHKHYCVWFSAKGIEGLFPEIFKRPLGERNLYSFAPDSFASLIARADRLMNAEGGREVAYAFYSFIERLFAEGSCDSASSTALPEDVALAVTFINENIASKITVGEIAEKAGVNITTLERHFAAVFRIPPLEYIKKTVADEKVEITLINGMNPSRISRTDCAEWDKVASAVASTWKGCIVSPYLMVQCSDSRHWGRLSDRVYRFSAMDLTSEERASIHGNNEKIRLDTLRRANEFYIRLMKKC